MFVIRQAKLEDLGTLLKLAKMVHFINLPSDKDIIAGKILKSRAAFRKAAQGTPASSEVSSNGQAPGAEPRGLASDTGEDVFMFVLEDTETGVCLGTSQVLAHMGGPGNPNYSFQLLRREFFSKSLQTGTTHLVARLHADESGPTEIGGLILQPASRGHRLGRFLSLVRFHFMALHRELFADRVIAEMMAPISLDGQNMLWEYLGRRFIPLSYTEADKHCQRSREFIAALLPKEDIYLALLPPEARDVIGRVGEETVPARRMLERLGFEYRNVVDPFDGGPHLEAATDKISLVRDTGTGVLGAAGAEDGRRGWISSLSPEGEFRAVETEFAGEPGGKVQVPREVMRALGWEAGMTVGVTPLDEPRRRRTSKGARPKKGRKTKRMRP